MEDCVFCQIVAGEVPATIVKRSAQGVAFRDINPQAPAHVLIVPKEHIAGLGETDDARLMGQLLLLARDVARDEGLESYRVVVNTGAEAGQSVFHLHLHLLGGRAMRWPPG